MNINRFKKRIKSSQIISFDLFDTLVYRPYLEPHDLFEHLEIIYQKKGFKDSRINAEKNVRFYSLKEEVTIDEIYDDINEEFKFIKNHELDLEFKTILLNTQIKSLLDYALSLNKIIILTTDTYLDKNFICKLLTKHSINIFNYIFISSEFGLTKYHGGIFKEITKCLKCNPNQILHIGDNINSDYRSAIKHGFKAQYYYSLNKQFKKKSSSNRSLIKLFKKNNPDFIQKYFFKHKINNLAFNSSNSDQTMFWKNIGFYYGSLVAFSFYEPIVKNYNPEKDELVFLGRDGYAAKLFFEIIRPDWKCNYIQAPRIISKNCVFPIDLSVENNIDFLYQLLNHSDNSESLDHKKLFINSNIKEYEKLFSNNVQIYLNYLKNTGINISKNIIFIDSGTHLFSSHKLFRTTLNHSNIHGIYWHAENFTNDIFDHTSIFRYCDKKSENIINVRLKMISMENNITLDWNTPIGQFVEFLLSSSEDPVIGINLNSFKPEYNKSNSNELKRNSIKPLVEDGLKEGALLIRQLIGDKLYFNNPLVLLNHINIFIHSLSKKEISYFKGIKAATDANHQNYFPLISSDDSFWRILFRKNISKYYLKYCTYLHKSQILAIMIRYPIIIRTSSTKKLIKIYIFPYLNKNIFNFSITFFRSFLITLSLGKQNIKSNKIICNYGA